MLAVRTLEGVTSIQEIKDYVSRRHSSTSG